MLNINQLYQKVIVAHTILKKCTLCPRQCRVDRLKGNLGFCRTAGLAAVSASLPHRGEEPPLSGQRGSGTIFFTHCNLHCCFCQNYQISQEGKGRLVTPVELAAMMLDLQAQGCHNLNLVSPTHVVPQILESLLLAVKKGFSLPIVYNSNGYESLDTLALLEGIVDIYLPDIKYSDVETACRLSDAPHYPAYNQPALLEMRRQVGNLQIDDNQVARRGLMIRHLVLPHNLAGSRASVQFLAENGFQNTWISILAQYHPTYQAGRDPEINRPISRMEYQQVLDWFEEYGFDHLWTQALESNVAWLPDFNAGDPFAGSRGK